MPNNSSSAAARLQYDVYVCDYPQFRRMSAPLAKVITQVDYITL